MCSSPIQRPQSQDTQTCLHLQEAVWPGKADEASSDTEKHSVGNFDRDTPIPKVKKNSVCTYILSFIKIYLFGSKNNQEEWRGRWLQ